MKGDFTPGKTVVVRFNTHKADGTPITLAGTPAISVYKNSTTQSTAGVSLTVDYDSLTGLHSVVVDTSADGTFYAASNDFDLIITAGTVDSISVVGTNVGGFSLSNRSALRPTTADRTLDVTTGGEAGVDWANVGSPTTTLNLSGTTVGTATAVTTVNGLAANVITAASAAPDFGAEIQAIITGGAYALSTDANGRVRIVDGTGAGEINTNAGAIALVDTVTTLINAPSDSSGITTLLSRVTSTRAGYLDNLSAGAVATAASIAALNNLSASQVNAEVVDALSTDTYAEPSQGAPGATISLAAKIAWLYASWRNRKTNDGETTNLYADDGTTVISKQLTSASAGTVEKAEWITGA